MAPSRPQLGTQQNTLAERVIAWLIDLVIVSILGGFVSFSVSVFLGFLGETFLLIVGTVTVFGYFIYFEGKSGQTIGKRPMDIMVVKTDGSPCGYGAAAIRNVLRVVDTIVPPYLVGLVAIYLTENNQRIGDLAAGTMVTRVAEGDGPTPDPDLDAERDRLDAEAERLRVERVDLDEDREQFERDRRQVDQDRQQLDRDRERLERDREQLERERAELERRKAEANHGWSGLVIETVGESTPDATTRRVRFTNTGSEPRKLAGATLRDAQGEHFEFPATDDPKLVLEPDEKATYRIDAQFAASPNARVAIRFPDGTEDELLVEN